MKKLSLTIVTILILQGFAWAQENAKQITIIGEVIETQCYVSGLTGPGKGAAHKACAVKCAKGGIPLSILEEKSDKVYLAGQSKKAMAGANEMLLPFIAEKVKVTGRLFEKGGMRLLLISKVEKFDAGKKQNTKK